MEMNAYRSVSAKCLKMKEKDQNTLRSKRDSQGPGENYELSRKIHHILDRVGTWNRPLCKMSEKHQEAKN